MRRRARFAVLGALAALSFGVAVAGGAGGQGFAMVKGEGTVDFGAAAPSEVAVFALRLPSGVAVGRVVQTDPGFGATVLDVRCVRPSTRTTRVAIGGVIVSSYAERQVGAEAVYIVDDLSSLGTGLVDQLGGAGLGVGGSTCPFDPGHVANPLDDLVSGDYRVKTHFSTPVVPD